MNRRSLFSVVGGLMVGVLGARFATAAPRGEPVDAEFVRKAKAMDGVGGWPKLAQLYPHRPCKSVSDALARAELHAAVDALNFHQTKTTIATIAALRFRFERGGVIAVDGDSHLRIFERTGSDT